MDEFERRLSKIEDKVDRWGSDPSAVKFGVMRPTARRKRSVQLDRLLASYYLCSIGRDG